LDVKDLKNYGVDIAMAMASLPREVRGKMEAASRRAALKHLGLLKTLRLPGLIKEEEAKMRNADVSPLRARGLDNDAFLAEARSQAAAFAAVARLAGVEKAVAVFEDVMREVSGDIWGAQAPRAEDFKNCGDAAASFRAYFRAMMEANRRTGVLEFDVVEDGPDAIQYDVTSCALLDLARLSGYPEAARHLCLADDLYFPDECRKIGLRFIRTGTLARGDSCCDFRFENVRENDGNTEE